MPAPLVTAALIQAGASFLSGGLQALFGRDKTAAEKLLEEQIKTFKRIRGQREYTSRVGHNTFNTLMRLRGGSSALDEHRQALKAALQRGAPRG